jgi:hypothetical protein
MRPLNLREFAEDMRRKGDIRQADMADDILALIDIEEEVAEPYSELCDDLQHYAPESLRENMPLALEWLGDRSNLLAEIEEILKASGRSGDIDDEIKKLIENAPAEEPAKEELTYDL